MFYLKILLTIALLILFILLLLFVAVIFLLKYRKRGQFFDANGCKIHYRVEGNGPPLILVHGYAINADINWRWSGLIRKLKKHFTVISFDLRGHGLSDKPSKPNSYGLEMVKDVVRLMDHLNIPKANVMGYSMGGFITLKLITMYPDRLIKAVVGGAGYEKAEGKNIKILMEIAESLESGKGYYPLTKALGKATKKPPFWQVKLNDFVINLLSDPQAMADVMKQFLEFEVSEESLRNNQVPVLAIVGTKDTLKGGVIKLEKYLSNAHFIYLKDRSHSTAIIGSKFYKPVIKFLKDN